MKEWFYKYVSSFKNEDAELVKNIILKEEHTIQVCKNIRAIGKSLKLRPNDLHIANIIALFHDIGRFEQYKMYRTFSDAKSVNHAELGVEILQKHKVLDNLHKYTKNLILKAISYHNRASLPKNETEECVFFTKLIRDADKLDIFRVVTEYYAGLDIGIRNKSIELDLPNTPGVSEKVQTQLLNKSIVNIKDIQTFNDFKLLQMGWIFDINFLHTFHSIKSKNYLEKISKTLPETKVTNEIFEVIYAHFEAVIEESVQPCSCARQCVEDVEVGKCVVAHGSV